MKTVNNLTFELYYSDNYCTSYKSLDKAINQLIKSTEEHPDIKHFPVRCIRNKYFSSTG